jgi:hypothetical protein
VAFLLLGALAVDYTTGVEISVFPVYALPIAAAVWSHGVRGGLILSAVCTLAWTVANLQHPYSAQWILFSNALMRAAFFVLVAVTAALIKRDPIDLRRPISATLVELDVCNSCKRVRDEERYWCPVEDYLAEHNHAEVKHKLCPDCARAAGRQDTQSRDGSLSAASGDG